MRKYVLILLLTVVAADTLFAQQAAKMNSEIFKLMHNTKASHAMTDVLLKGNIAEIRNLTSKVGGVFKYSAGNIAAVRIPVSSLNNFIASKDVTRIESYKRKIMALNDTMRVKCNVNEVQQGLYPLTQGYDGSGIVVGFIDSGVDFAHPDFIDSANHSRVKYIWDMSMPDSANTPQPFGYGQEWTNTQIDNSIAGNQSAFREWGHGTAVTGIATGNGRAANVNKGVAPKADIIMVAYDFYYSGPETRIADAVHYIFSKADSMGKPCVINASLGDIFGSHDGQDLEALMIDSELTAKKGRCMVAAVGNWAAFYYHLGYDVSSVDTNFSWYENNPGNQIYFQMWGDSNTFKNIHFAIAAEDTNTWTIHGIYPFSTIESHLGIDIVDTLFDGNVQVGLIETAGSTQGGLYEMEFLITPDMSNGAGSYLWRLMTTGSGHFDLWSSDRYLGLLPSASVLPSIIYYKSPDRIMNTSSSFACSDQVITVANYTNRSQHYDCMDSLITFNEIPNAISPTSSVGPTRDRRQKPDIAAPGDQIASCTVTEWIGNIVPRNSPNLALGCYHIVGGGSSGASPIVAGIAALYLQKYPNASNVDIKKAITGCAKTDAWTGQALPDYHWGYGKVDAFHALTGCHNTNDETQNDGVAILYPNPFSQSATLALHYPFLPSSIFHLVIYNVMGSEVQHQDISGSGQFIIERASLNNGMYFFDVMNGNNTIARGKMIVVD